MKTWPGATGKIMLLIGTLMIVSLACTVSTSSGNPEATALALEGTRMALAFQQTSIAMQNQQPTTIQPTNVVATNMPAPDISLGEKYESIEGGFSFKKIPDYLVEEMDGGYVTLMAQNADPDYGPILVAYNDIFVPGMTIEEGLEDLTESFSEESELEFKNREQVIVDGAAGLSIDVNGKLGEEEVGGRFVLVKSSSTKVLILMGLAPASKWPDLEQKFDVFMESVRFLEQQANEPLCGNGVCGDFENPGNCPQDCGSPNEPLCGNGVCGDFENPGNCPQDCGSPNEPLCGNGVCGDFENPGNCPQDCGSPNEPLCGNGVCGDFENPGNCPQDCGSPNEPLCGNGVCGDFENPGNCPQDCSSPNEPLCGNGVCGDFENPGNCPQDCGSPNEPLCGNGVCGDFENPGNCPQDCGSG